MKSHQHVSSSERKLLPRSIRGYPELNPTYSQFLIASKFAGATMRHPRAAEEANDRRVQDRGARGRAASAGYPMGISVSVDIWSAVACRDKKALQKRRQKLGVSASDISRLKLSRRSRHVLPAWSSAPCPD